METIRIEGGGGVGLSLRVAGPEEAPAILLLHGWSQHSLAWQKQLCGPLAERFRLGALDLRGHGASDAPADPAAFQDGARWAGDVAAALSALGAPAVIVGWSMGGWLLQDYLRRAGDGSLAGVVFVGARCRIGARAEPPPPSRARIDRLIGEMCAPDHARQIEGAIGFAKAMTLAPLSKRDLAAMVGWQMLCGPLARAACRARDEDWRPDLRRVGVPALVIHGAGERLVPRADYEELRASLPGAEGVVYEGSGHAPFWEEADRFDSLLGAFAARAHGVAEAAA